MREVRNFGLAVAFLAAVVAVFALWLPKNAVSTAIAHFLDKVTGYVIGATVIALVLIVLFVLVVVGLAVLYSFIHRHLAEATKHRAEAAQAEVITRKLTLESEALALTNHSTAIAMKYLRVAEKEWLFDIESRQQYALPAYRIREEAAPPSALPAPEGSLELPEAPPFRSIAHLIAPDGV